MKKSCVSQELATLIRRGSRQTLDEKIIDNVAWTLARKYVNARIGGFVSNEFEAHQTSNAEGEGWTVPERSSTSSIREVRLTMCTSQDIPTLLMLKCRQFQTRCINK